MGESQVEKKREVNSLALILISVVSVAAVFCAALNFVYPAFVNLLVGNTYVSGGSIYDSIFVVLTVAEYALYLFGGGVVTFGAMLVIIRFIQFKLKDPYQASSSTRYLSGYLTLSLNFFIGAEIIRTVATRTFSDFELLLLVIFSRGLFSLILYLERRWHGTAETE
ncbi:MAG TPA: DUF1622 domain-containing protein [Candidatus Acidoferrales bacterium]|nr:DUF1622 domain-containing protein [Candidatus Acidoferrales bacterium]